MHPKQNLLLTSHVGVEKHWAWSQKIWVEVPLVMCCASKRSIDESEIFRNMFPLGYSNLEARPVRIQMQQTDILILKVLALMCPVLAHFILFYYSILFHSFHFLFLLFLNGGILEGRQSRFGVSHSEAALKGTFLGDISLRDIRLPSFFPCEEVRRQRG